MMTETASTAAPLCTACGLVLGDDIACGGCGQVYGLPVGVQIVGNGIRIGAHLLDGLLCLLTLFIGWAIWSLIVWSDGQTPAKKLLGIRVLDTATGRPATWGRMALREIVGKGIIGQILSTLTIGIILAMPLWDRKRQSVWDKVAGTLVVTEPRIGQ